MSTSNTHQQTLADAGSETRPSMLERGSYIPWTSRFRRYLNRKRDNRKWLNKAIDEGPYEFQIFTPSDIEALRMQKEEDLRGDDLKHHEAEIEAMNLILISILNDIYNSVDACKTKKSMWQRVERLMRANLSQVRLAKRLTEDTYDDLFDYLQQFEKLVNASRAKRLEKSHDPLALVAHTGSSSKTTSHYYVTHPSSVVDYDEDYQEYSVQNNSKDPLTSAMILLARAITQRFSNPTNNRLCTSSNTRNQAIVQGDRVNIQSRNSGNDGRNTRRSYVQEEIIEGNNVQNDARHILGNDGKTMQVRSYVQEGYLLWVTMVQNVMVLEHHTAGSLSVVLRMNQTILIVDEDEAGVILIDEHNDFLFVDALRMEEIKELSANIYFMAKIQPTNFDSDKGPSYDSTFLSKVQTPSTSYVNPLFAKDT
ncbi:hypothetical protein Tco_1182029 [Tanacetum coccineum]